MSDVSCPRRHRLVRFEVVPCRVHGTHRVFVCPMRLGNNRCGEKVAVPAIGAGCEP